MSLSTEVTDIKREIINSINSEWQNILPPSRMRADHCAETAQRLAERDKATALSALINRAKEIGEADLDLDRTIRNTIFNIDFALTHISTAADNVEGLIHKQKDLNEASKQLGFALPKLTALQEDIKELKKLKKNI